MSNKNKKPSKKLNLEKHTDYVKFEIWEVLTFLTAVLTLASGLFWFSNFHPKMIEDEFVNLDKQKNTIYTQYLFAERIAKKNVKLLETDKESVKRIKEGKDLSEKLLTINNQTDYQNKMNNLAVADSSIQASLGDFGQNWIIGNNIERIQPTISSLEGFLEQAKIIQEKEFAASNRVVRIREAVVNIESKEFENIESEISIIQQNIADLREYQLTENEVFFEQSEFFADSLIRFYQSEEALKFETIFNSYFEYIFSVDSDSLVKDPETNINQEFLNRLAEFETWQKEFIKNNPALEERVIFILV
jgi:hypothetical protein